MLRVPPAGLMSRDICRRAGLEGQRLGRLDFRRSTQRPSVLDGIDGRRDWRAFEQLAALHRLLPCFRQTDCVERSQTHLASFAAEAIPENPAAPTLVRRDLQPQPTAVAVQAGIEVL